MGADGVRPVQFFGRDLADDLARNTHDHGARRDSAALRQHGAGGDDALLADLIVSIHLLPDGNLSRREKGPVLAARPE